MANELREQIKMLVDEYLDRDEFTLRKLGDGLSLPEQGITFSEGAIGNWRYRTSQPDVFFMRDVAKYHPEAWAREFATRVLAIYGLRVIE